MQGMPFEESTCEVPSRMHANLRRGTQKLCTTVPQVETLLEILFMISPELIGLRVGTVEQL